MPHIGQDVSRLHFLCRLFFYVEDVNVKDLWIFGLGPGFLLQKSQEFGKKIIQSMPWG